MEEFRQFSDTQKRNILGEILFPKVDAIADNHAPKITGMLIDLKVMKLDEIIAMIEDDEKLYHRVKEAEILVGSQMAAAGGPPPK